MRINKKSSVITIVLTILLLVQIIGPAYILAEENGTKAAVSSSIQETMVHTYSQNTWAWNSLATGPNGEIYLTHKISSTEIAIKKWNGSAWSSLPSVKTSMTGDTGFSDSLDLAVDASGKLHLVFKHYIGSGVTSKRGVKYGVYNGTSWSFSEVEAYSHPSGGRNFYDPALDVDSQGHAHIVYKYVDTSYYARYATNKSGAWQINNIAVGTSAIDEVHKPGVQVDGNDVIHLSYVKEDNQNNYYGNFYYTKKALNDASFPTAQKVVDAVAEKEGYYYSPLAVDSEGNGYFTYSVSNYDSDWNFLSSVSYIQSNVSGIWKREALYTDQVRDTYPVGVYTVDSTLYVLMDSWSADWSENHFFAMADYGAGWITGNKTVKPALVLDSTNELTYLVDSNGHFMLAMLHGNLKKISSLTGTSEDFGLVQALSGNADLSSITLSDGTLSPVFDGEITNYTASVENIVTDVDITSIVSDVAATITVNGSVVASGNAANIPLTVGVNTISVMVTAQDGTTKTYTLVVTRELLKGDGSGDGKVTSADALMVYQAVAGKIQLTDLQKKALDMNNDGKIDATDANLIMKAAVEKK
ncbi:cadherin-like beta sandwich domain-containing protein [Domibacillus mangrovi]|uniref:Dockerin domain-containing protein n=1 Tax=Domibacillus mangrovi TaxID=1714354 RepID=A0A1Q5P217_9BACI|nr:cadherin-like beta sandwich domain-containing protein [Domibacillus mangrovi]OKL36238.1 hypothetical protein BLL40_10010 [Domibacillus mangrovi]